MISNRASFDQHLQTLRAMLIEMGDAIKQSMLDAVHALQTSDLALAKQIIDQDVNINRMEDKIESFGTMLIATQQPVAKDLRRILIAFRMASDLERMADLAVDIARAAIRVNGEPLIKPLVDIPRMAEYVQQMTQDCINAYIDENVDLAYKMAKMDDDVDELYSKILRELFMYIADQGKSVNQAVLLCFVARYLERMADHATNIGESVVFLVTGQRPDLN